MFEPDKMFRIDMSTLLRMWEAWEPELVDMEHRAKMLARFDPAAAWVIFDAIVEMACDLLYVKEEVSRRGVTVTWDSGTGVLRSSCGATSQDWKRDYE